MIVLSVYIGQFFAEAEMSDVTIIVYSAYILAGQKFLSLRSKLMLQLRF